MATSHPYISGPGNVGQIITHLRKNFPSTVNADVVKRLGLAPKNESYVINALQFLGIIDEEGKRTQAGTDVFSKHDESEFAKAFEALVVEAYDGLHELHGEDMWALSRDKLIGYFRSADKTSAAIGARQAGLFAMFATFAGHGGPENKTKRATKPKAAATARTKKPSKPEAAEGFEETRTDDQGRQRSRDKGGMALTVRIEINIPAGATKENYDDMFKSIRANLLND